MPPKKKVKLSETTEIKSSYYWKVPKILNSRKLEKESIGRMSKKHTKKSNIFSEEIYLSNLMKMNFIALLSCLLENE